MMPTLNRKEDLAETLTRLREQSYHNIEVVVVDNGSTDGTPEMVWERFPEVKLIRMPRNVGAIAARNIGFSNTRGKYVLHLDDDSFPGRHVISRMVEEFERDERLGLIAFGVLDYWQFWAPHGWASLDEEVPPAADKAPKSVIDWIGCGGGIRRELLDQVGYYEEWGLEAMFERSLSVRILNADYTVKTFPDVYVYHHWSKKGEPSAYRLADEAMFTGCRSIALFYFKYYPVDWLLYHLWRLVFAACYACVEQRRLMYIRALFSALKMAPSVWKERQTLRLEVLRDIRTPFNFKGK